MNFKYIGDRWQKSDKAIDRGVLSARRIDLIVIKLISIRLFDYSTFVFLIQKIYGIVELEVIRIILILKIRGKMQKYMYIEFYI